MRASRDGALRVRAAARSGPTWLYGGSYSDQDLSWWADRIHEWEVAGLDVYAYFNNDGGGHAVRNAWTLSSLLERSTTLG